MYRVEVSRRDLTRDQDRQFIQAARSYGFRVNETRNGWAISIEELTERQAITIRDELATMGIHSSIGVCESIRR